MATWRDVSRIATALPGVTEGPSKQRKTTWSVKEKSFAWERPLRKSDLAFLGADAPDGPILAVRTADIDMRDAFLATYRPALFITPHFNNYPAVLINLDEITLKNLKTILTEAWLAKAPSGLADPYLRKRTSRQGKPGTN